jgi:Ca2+-binding EF-hand superfamily protein
VFDADHDGFVPVSVVRNVLSVLKNKLPDDRVDSLLQKLARGDSVSIVELVRELRPT